MPDSSSRPCIAPSSPRVPCSTGNTRSSLIVSYLPCSSTRSPCTLRSGDSTAGRHLPSSQSTSGPSQSLQAPAFVIPIQNGSYRSVSRAFAISRADLTETGCSSELPPNMIAIFNLSTPAPALEPQAIDQGLFHGVAQGVVRVV